MKLMSGARVRDVRADKVLKPIERMATRDTHNVGRHAEVVRDWRFLRTGRGETHVVGRFSTTGKHWATPPLVRLYARERVVVARDGRRFALLAGPGEPNVAQLLVSLFAAFDETLRGRIEDITQHVCVFVDLVEGLYPFSTIVELDVTETGVKVLDFSMRRRTIEVRR
ncbi:hypothetical protein [Cupriavidus taiwanensis]|uniref:hypothetical protein n=1 Tax=Cupriavidus taiwanensis TaxID=164546 RepID=UPI0011C03CEF|nr:hypothetical protein [Cupriavidus taiwanensis]